MIGRISDGFSEEYTIFLLACTLGCGCEEEANLARLSAMSFPGIPLCPGTTGKQRQIPLCEGWDLRSESYS